MKVLAPWWEQRRWAAWSWASHGLEALASAPFQAGSRQSQQQAPPICEGQGDHVSPSIPSCHLRQAGEKTEKLPQKVALAGQSPLTLGPLPFPGIHWGQILETKGREASTA